MSVTILGKNVLVKELETDKVSGIIVANSNSQDATLEGEIIGYGKFVEQEAITTGNIAIFKRFQGLEIILDKEKYLMLKEDDILAIKEK